MVLDNLGYSHERLKDIIEGIEWQFTSTKFDFFLPFETHVINPRSLKDWRKNYIGMSIDGTTFSGHPTRTTLGNTL